MMKKNSSSEGLIYDKSQEFYKNTSEFKTISNWVGQNKSVLELGCHTAVLGGLLEKNNNIVTGIDVNPDAIKKAQSVISNAQLGNLDDPNLIENNSLATYDVVICNQVLEHLLYPDIALTNIYKSLKKDGIAIIGLPNVCNAKTRFHITFGNFNYADEGVLDRTHVRFYNQKSARKMIMDSGFKITDYNSPWRVNPIKEFTDNVPYLTKIRSIFSDKPFRFFSPNITDVVMLFKCVQ